MRANAQDTSNMKKKKKTFKDKVKDWKDRIINRQMDGKKIKKK